MIAKFDRLIQDMSLEKMTRKDSSVCMEESNQILNRREKYQRLVSLAQTSNKEQVRDNDGHNSLSPGRKFERCLSIDEQAGECSVF